MSSEHEEGAHVGDGFCPECYGLVRCWAVSRPPIIRTPNLNAMPHAICALQAPAGSGTGAAAGSSGSTMSRLCAGSASPVTMYQPVSPPQGHSKIEKRDVKGFREIFVRAFECEDCGHK